MDTPRTFSMPFSLASVDLRRPPAAHKEWQYTTVKEVDGGHELHVTVTMFAGDPFLAELTFVSYKNLNGVTFVNSIGKELLYTHTEYMEQKRVFRRHYIST